MITRHLLQKPFRMVCGPTVSPRGTTTTSRHFTVKQIEDPVVKCTVGSISDASEPDPKLPSVDQSQPLSSMAKDGHTERKTVVCDKSIFSKLTPTMRAFTLEGKVAVITG